MKFDVTIISVDEYLPEKIVRQDIPRKYLYNQEGDFCLTATIFDSEKTVFQLVTFLFRDVHSVNEIYRNMNAYVFDLTPYRHQLLNFDEIELHYPRWIEETGRNNTMDEYGMLIDFAGHIKKGLSRKYLLLIVSNERHNN